MCQTSNNLLIVKGENKENNIINTYTSVGVGFDIKYRKKILYRFDDKDLIIANLYMYIQHNM